MSNYVASYRRLDDNAARAESQADEYRQRADENRWEQCRIAHEAVESGEFTRKSFAEAVTRNRSTIEAQYRAWASYAGHAPHTRPTYAEAMNEAAGDSNERKIASSARTAVRRMQPQEKARLVEELLDDPDVEIAPATVAKQAARPDVARAIARNDEARERVEDEAIAHRARHMPDDLPEPAAAGRRAGANMARKLDTDLATSALRAAAGSLAEAILCKEEFGVNHSDQEAEALNKIERYLAAYKGGGHVSDTDRNWLASIGVEL